MTSFKIKVISIDEFHNYDLVEDYFYMSAQSYAEVAVAVEKAYSKSLISMKIEEIDNFYGLVEISQEEYERPQNV